MWIQVYSNSKQTSIPKLVEREVFLMKPKHQNHLSLWGECVYGAQSWSEWRLLCESVLVQNDRPTLILKIVAREVFLLKPKHQHHLS